MNVLNLPIMLTPILVRWPTSAIHSLRADITISRQTIIMAGMANHGVANLDAQSNNAVQTINLSATGSRKAPKRDISFKWRAKNPSSQSVTAAKTKTPIDTHS